MVSGKTEVALSVEPFLDRAPGAPEDVGSTPASLTNKTVGLNFSFV